MVRFFLCIYMKSNNKSSFMTTLTYVMWEEKSVFLNKPVAGRGSGVII